MLKELDAEKRMDREATVGATGATGATGAAGPAGTSSPEWYYGTAAPDNANGSDVDLYLQQGVAGVSPTIMYVKIAGVWTEITRLVVSA